LAGIRSSLAEAATTAVGPTTGIATAGQDEVSIAIASMFGNYGREFQALSAQAQAFHEEFIGLLNAGAGAYLSAEAANAGQGLLGGAGDGGILGNIEQSIGGTVSGAEAAIGRLAGNVGQGLSGAVTALQNGSAGALVGGEIRTGAQAISNAIASAPAAAPTLIQGFDAFGATVAAPYQALFSNTVTNLQAIESTFAANPFPFLHQIVNNQIGYAQTIASSIGTGIQNLPAELANMPATIQAGIHGLATFNPDALLQQFVNNQIGYAQTIATSLQSAGPDISAGLPTLSAGFQTAFQDLLAGNNIGASAAFNQALVNFFLPGFQDITIPLSQLGAPGTFSVIPLGLLGDLAPIFAIPGQMAQNFTNLLPVGSIPAQMAQNFTNLVNAVTNFGTTLSSQNLAITFGLPLQFIFDAIGAPANAMSALNSSAVAFVDAVQAGNVSAAAAALLDAPAVVANGFLNGQMLVSLPPLTVDVTFDGATLASLTETSQIPLGGLLTPLSNVVLTQGGPLPGTELGGFIPGLLSFESELAAAITPIT
jgi:PE family